MIYRGPNTAHDRGVPVAYSGPAWLPSAGTFSNLSCTNTLFSARPSGWPTSDAGAPFANWSGGVWAPDFGTQGGYVVHGSGHLSADSPIWAGVWVFDVATLTWVGRNVPSQPLLERGSTDYNDYFESNITATLGHTYAPHTYDGLVYRPPTEAGDGHLVRLQFGGGGKLGAKSVHTFDLSSPTAPPTRVIDDTGLGGVSSSYPASAVDYGRNGIWLLSYTGVGPLKFISLADWSITSHVFDFNAYGDQALIYLPPPYDCILATGRDGSGGVDRSMRVSRIISGVPQAFTSVSVSGTDCPDRRAGGVWCSALNAVVMYGAAGSYTAYKVTPPGTGATLTSGTWAWTSETLTGNSGATPSHNAVADNGACSRFVYAAELGCFFWCDSINDQVQAWRLTGV